MLVVTRRMNQGVKIIVGDEVITVKVLGVKSSTGLKLGFEGGANVVFLREEVVDDPSRRANIQRHKGGN